MAIDPKQLFLAKKTLVSKPAWVATDSTWFKLTGVLDMDGATLEGLEIRGSAVQSAPEKSVGFHLQYHPSRGPCVPLCRIDWRPTSIHTNPNCGPKNLRLLRINGTHIHGFESNWLDAEGRMRTGNLPVAAPFDPDPKSFNELLAVVGNELRIDGLERIEPPAWREQDMFGS